MTPATRERTVNVLRLAFGLLAAIALGFQGYRTSTNGASMSNFFSYFTNLSNMAGVVVLLVGGTLGLMGRRGVPDEIRGAVVLYMSITGLVYEFLLSGYDLGLLLPWVNNVVHRLMPVIYFADWLITPPRRRLSHLTTLKWLIFPLLYLPYSLIRGAIIHWYPYPFLDPTHPGGYGRVAGACTLITAAFVGIALLLVRIGNALSHRQGERAAPHRAVEPGVHT